VAAVVAVTVAVSGSSPVEAYLKAVSWSIPGYSLENYRDRLRALYEDASAWPVVTSGHRFLLVASKPTAQPRAGVGGE
jgi:hypothetical protein